MKPRRVVLTVELDTDRSLKILKEDAKDVFGAVAIVIQVQANVIKPVKK